MGSIFSQTGIVKDHLRLRLGASRAEADDSSDPSSVVKARRFEGKKNQVVRENFSTCGLRDQSSALQEKEKRGQRTTRQTERQSQLVAAERFDWIHLDGTPRGQVASE